MAGACSGRIDLHQRLTVVAIDADERAAFLRAWRQFLSGQPSSLSGEVIRGGQPEVLSVDAHANGEFERARIAEQDLLDRSDARQRELGTRHASDPLMALAPLVIDHGSSQSLHRDDGAALSLLSRAATLRPVVVLTDRPTVVQWAAALDPSVGYLVEWSAS